MGVPCCVLTSLTGTLCPLVASDVDACRASKLTTLPSPVPSPSSPPALAVARAPPPQPDPDGPSLANKREVFLRECVPVLQQAGGSLPVKKLQPDYQTMYKRSPRASDYGVEALKELFKTSPLFKVRVLGQNSWM